MDDLTFVIQQLSSLARVLKLRDGLVPPVYGNLEVDGGTKVCLHFLYQS